MPAIKKEMAAREKRNSPPHGKGGVAAIPAKGAIGLLGKKAVYLNFLSQVCFIRYFWQVKWILI
jgi:hypothetical protein